MEDSANSASLVGSKHIWKSTTNPASSFNGYYTAALQPQDGSVTTLPQGDGYLTFTVSTAGVVTWSGQLADGTVVAATSATLWADGSVPLFKLLYTNKGALSQSLQIVPDARTLRGAPHWSKQPQPATVRAYASGFAPTELSILGAEYLPPVAGTGMLDIELSVDQPGYGSIDFAGGEIEGVDQVAQLTQIFEISATRVITFVNEAIINPVTTKFTKVDLAKGTFTGSMALKDDNLFTGVLPQISRTVSFSGVLIPSSSMGTGYFLLPSIIGPPANVKTSPMTSGLVRITP